MNNRSNPDPRRNRRTPAPQHGETFYNQASTRRSSYRAPGHNRTQMPSAREELERERHLYSQHAPGYQAPVPAERFANEHADERDIMAPFRAHQHQGTGGLPRIEQPASRGTTSGFTRPYRLTPEERASAPAPRATRRPENTGQWSAPQGQTGQWDAPSSRAGRPTANQTGQWTSEPEGASVPQRPLRSSTPRSRAATRDGHASETGTWEANSRGRYARPSRSQAPLNLHDDFEASRPDRPYDSGRRRRPAYAEEAPQQRDSYGNMQLEDSFMPSRRGHANEKRGFSLPNLPSLPNINVSKPVIIGIAVVLVLAVSLFFGVRAISAMPVTVTVNGAEKTVSGNERTIEGLLDANIATAKAGNYIAVDNSVITQGGGTRCTAKVNDRDTTDLATRLNNGDSVTISNGTDVMEDYTDSNKQEVPATFEKKGSGALHVFTGTGESGEKVTRTGNESGKTAEVVTKEPSNRTLMYYNANTNGEKVIALTFDDGPWEGQTQEIMDILAQNDAKATFYSIGQQIAGYKDLVKQMSEAGHELATHTWDHAEGSGQGVSLILMSTAERQAEVNKGNDAIKEATGQEASKAFRAPGGNFDEAVARDLNGIVTAEIGWNVDTQDWRKPGAEAIAERIKSAQPGNVVLMHDGGGDRSQTVEGLRMALPYLKEQGYSFITVSELIERYPPSENA